MNKPIKINLFDNLNEHSNLEIFEKLVKTPSLLIEKITSNGQATPEGEWFDQEEDEWVILVTGEATLRFEDGDRWELKAGDYTLIPAHCRHRVDHTSIETPCIWLAVHGNLQQLE